MQSRKAVWMNCWCELSDKTMSLHSLLLKRTFFHACYTSSFSGPLFHKSRTSQWTVNYPHVRSLSLQCSTSYCSLLLPDPKYSSQHLMNTPKLTPRKNVLPEKLTVPQLVKNPLRYSIRNSITVFTSVRHMSLSWARLIRLTEHVSLWSILIVSFHYA